MDWKEFSIGHVDSLIKKNKQTRPKIKGFGYRVLGFGGSAAAGANFISASGGTDTTDGNTKIHTYNSSANFVVNVAGSPAPVNSLVSVLVVADK